MPFIEELLKYESVSVVGLAKNAGKTECLNYILDRVKDMDKCFAITSIGVDGESKDQIFQIDKPEIKLYEGMLFVTSENFYKTKRLVSEIVNVGKRQTSLGRLVTARVLTEGKVLLSGPADTNSLKELIKSLKSFGVDNTIVDGALSRLSLASPAVTDAMVLATGAAVSCNIPELVRKTKYVYDLISLDKIDLAIESKLSGIESGVWTIGDNGDIHDLALKSVLMLQDYEGDLFQYGTSLYVAGVVTDKLLYFLRQHERIKEIVIIVKDFTKIFASQEAYNAYRAKGGQIKVLQKTKLISVCVNPYSPEGYILNSDELILHLEKSLNIPVYNVRNLRNGID